MLFRSDYEQRLADVETNARLLRAIVETLRQMNQEMKIIFTLSPVPLSRVTNGRSALVCDVLSKSTLRIAIEGLMNQGLPGVYYWPAFEIVRGLALHTGPMFGMDDGQPRHVNNAIVHLIMKLFIKYFAALT